MTTSLSDFARDLAADTRTFVVDYVGKAISGAADRLGQQFEIRLQSIKDGKDGRDGKDADPAVLDALKNEVTELRIQIAELKAQPKSQPMEPAAIASLLTEAVKAIPAPRDGKDGRDGASVDRAEVEAMVKAAVAAIPPPKDGRDGVSVDLDDVEQLVQRAVSALPAPKDGRDGVSVDRSAVLEMVKECVASIPAPKDGKDGTSVDRDDVLAMVKSAVAEIPKPQDGRDGTSIDRGDVLAMVKSVVAEIPIPKDGIDGKDGRSVTVDDVQPLVEAAVTKAVSAIPPVKDGVGVQDAVIDREGSLVLTFTDGRTKNVGVVVGADVDPEHVKQVIGEAIAAFPRPKDGVDGKDGLGFDDMDLFFDDQKGCAVVRLSRGAQIKEYDLPWWAHRGTFQAGTRYRKGHHVISRGSTFVCVEDTTDRPGDGTSKAWRLVAARGKDGKDGKDAVSE